MSNAGVAETFADWLRDLGDVSPSRVRLDPPVGKATIDDLVRANTCRTSPPCELIDQSLVEKAMGYEASVVAAAIIRILCNFVVPSRLGVVSGADGMFQLPAGQVRAPDVAFISRERLRDERIREQACPAIAPDFVVEVLSPGNTKAEMSRKRIEYFSSGVRLVWIVDCIDRSVAVYTSPSEYNVLSEDETIGAGDVLPGFTNPVAEFFADLDLLAE